MTVLTEHFTVEEFEDSDTAARLRIDNSVPEELMKNLLATAKMLEKIREHLSFSIDGEVPIRITSGFRCYKLNRTIGGSRNSHHMSAHAADWVAPGYGSPYQICTKLEFRMEELGIGQLIHEYGRWVHTSVLAPSTDRNRVLTATSSGYKHGVQFA